MTTSNFVIFFIPYVLKIISKRTLAIQKVKISSIICVITNRTHAIVLVPTLIIHINEREKCQKVDPYYFSILEGGLLSSIFSKKNTECLKTEISWHNINFQPLFGFKRENYREALQRGLFEKIDWLPKFKGINKLPSIQSACPLARADRRNMLYYILSYVCASMLYTNMHASSLVCVNVLLYV